MWWSPPSAWRVRVTPGTSLASSPASRSASPEHETAAGRQLQGDAFGGARAMRHICHFSAGTQTSPPGLRSTKPSRPTSTATSLAYARPLSLSHTTARTIPAARVRSCSTSRYTPGRSSCMRLIMRPSKRNGHARGGGTGKARPCTCGAPAAGLSLPVPAVDSGCRHLTAVAAGSALAASGPAPFGQALPGSAADRPQPWGAVWPRRSCPAGGAARIGNRACIGGCGGAGPVGRTSKAW